MSTTVLSCRVPDEIAERVDAQLRAAGLKNRSQAVGAAVLAWLRQKEGGKSLEDRIAARIQEMIRQELARVQVHGAGTQAQEPQGPPPDQVLAFLRAGRH